MKLDFEPLNRKCRTCKLTNQKETLERKQIRKGMVLIDNIDKFKSFVTKSFKARINILHHSTTIKTGYAPVIHCGPIRQSAKIDLEFLPHFISSNKKKYLDWLEE